MNKYDVIIVGCGPAGIFTALEMLKKGSKKKVLMIEKGQSVEHRSCPKAKLGKCVHCDPCSITTGFSGAGAFSDGKLSLSSSVGAVLDLLYTSRFTIASSFFSNPNRIISSPS